MKRELPISLNRHCERLTGARQSISFCFGLLRRFAPRNDGGWFLDSIPRNDDSKII